MDEELKLKLLVLIKNPESILPNLRLTRPSPQEINSKNNFNLQNLSEEANSAAEPPKEPSPQSVLTDCCALSENTCNYHGMSGIELHSLIQGYKVIEFCQENGLIATQVTCSCGKQMVLRARGGIEGYMWRCYRACHKSKMSRSVRKGTWFEKSNMTVSDILWIAYMWVHEYSYMSFLHECDHSSHTLMTWNGICLDTCRKIVESKSNPIGGKGKTVEIFVCEINVDEVPTQFAFCAIEQSGTNYFCTIIDDKKSSTLQQIFSKFIQPETNVVANNWSFLKNLNRVDFEHLTKEKVITFTDLVTDVRMEMYDTLKIRTSRPNIRDEWSELKYGPSLLEKIYRKSLKSAPDAFLTFLKDVATIYKPWDKCCTCLTVDNKASDTKSHKCEIDHHVNTKLQ